MKDTGVPFCFNPLTIGSVLLDIIAGGFSAGSSYIAIWIVPHDSRYFGPSTRWETNHEISFYVIYESKRANRVTPLIEGTASGSRTLKRS